MKRISLFLLLVLLSLRLWSEQSSFTVQFASDSINWNPHYAVTTSEHQIFTAIYEGLVNYHPASLRPVPGVAESWVIADDGLSVSFTLRKNLKWSNGDHLTSEDFKESWLRLLSPETASDFASLIDDIRGAKDYRMGKGRADSVGIETPNARTLILRLNQASPQIISILCHFSFVPVHRDFRNMKDWSAVRSVPVNGPFVIQARNLDEIILNPNRLYWDRENIAIDILKLIFLDDPDEVMKRFNRFEIDWSVSGMDLEQLSIQEALSISRLFATTYYYFSNRDVIWSDPRIRRALAMLLPWEDIRRERTVPAASLIPPIPDYPAADADFPALESRLDEAKRLLGEAGYPKGKGLPAITIRVPREIPPEVEIMRETWTGFGLEVTIEVIEYQYFYDSLEDDGYTISTLTWVGDYADPLTFLGMWESESSFNDAGFSNEDYDKILRESALLPPLERFKKLSQAEKILLETCQVIPIDHFPSVNLIDSRFVEGWYANVLDIHPFKNIVPKLNYHIPGMVRR